MMATRNARIYKSQVELRWKHVAMAFITLVVLACGSIAWMKYSLSHMHLDLSGLANFVGGVSAVVETANGGFRPCNSANGQSLGDSRREATMVYVAGVVDLYRNTFGKLPENMSDLDKLPTFENADKLNGDEMQKTCFIGQLPSTPAYVLSCGGRLPLTEQLDAALKRAALKRDGNERFVVVDGSEVLYVPFSGGCI
jgi:hypothetical protein